MNEKRFFLRDKTTVTMGNCNSVICFKYRAGKSEQNVEGEDIEETPVVEIRLNCPPMESELQMRQDTMPAAQVPSKTSSFELLDVDSADEQSLSDSTYFLSDGECESVGFPQDCEEHFNFEVQGKSCLPKNVTVTGLAQQNDFQGCALAPVERSAGSWNENQLQRQGNSNDESTGLHRTVPKISIPLPRPSLWQQVYSKTLKKRERKANEKFNKKAQCHAKKEDKFRNLARSVRAKTSMRLKVDQDPDNGPAARTPDETITRRSGGGVEDSSDSSSSNISSSESSRLSSSESRHSLVTSDKDSESANNGQKSGRRSRKWFHLKNNKVVPL